jgi:shikimate kinase
MHAPIDTILKRTMHTSHRPLLQVENPEQRLRDLYAQREAIYRRTGTMVLTDSRPLREIVAHVLRVYRLEAAHFKK